jgi:hypothetical protein
MDEYRISELVEEAGRLLPQPGNRGGLFLAPSFQGPRVPLVFTGVPPLIPLRAPVAGEAAGE